MLILAAALGLRLGAMAATPGFEPGLDAAHYDGLACALVLDGRYPLRVPAGRNKDSCGRLARRDNPPTAFRPPGWPALLAGIYELSGQGNRWVAARIAQALIGTAAVALIGLAGFMLLGPVGALVALALAAADTTLLAVGASMLSEPLFVMLIAAALVAALKSRERRSWRWALGAGVLLGLATLVRTNGLVLVPVLAALAAPRPWLSRRALATGAVILAGSLAALAPWTVRNEVAMHAFIPVADYFGTGLAGTLNDVSRTRTDFPGGWESPRNVPAFQDIHHSSMSELDKQRELQRRALRYARKHPAYVVKASALNTLRMLSLTSITWYRNNAQALSLPRWTGPVAAAGFWVLLALVALALVRGAARRLPGAVWIATPLLIASAVLFGGEMRYRAPVMPFLILAAAAGFARRSRGAPT